jgi:CRISP-associated protein Cas1
MFYQTANSGALVGNRVVDITGKVHLTIDSGRLIVRKHSEIAGSIALIDIGAIIVSNPSARMSMAVISQIAETGGIVVCTDKYHLPTAMMASLQSHSLPVERVGLQINATKPTLKRCWQEVVVAKLKAQGGLLQEIYNDDFGLMARAGLVRSGDPENMEAQGARIYWSKLFGGTFRRDRQAPGRNGLLNYGYAVLRAQVARRVAGAGLYSAIGIHHHNRYNAFCLVDDLMEPFRPIVDRAVEKIFSMSEGEPEVDRRNRTFLIELSEKRYLFGGEERTLWSHIGRTVNGFVGVLAGERKKIGVPDLLIPVD